MKTVLLLLFSCVTANANNSIYDVSCSDRFEGLYFEPVSGVRGRISLQWCTAANTKVKKWNLNLSYYTSLKPEQCISNSSSKDHHLHSSFDEVVPVNLNCTNVCFKTILDAIFHSTCYKISTSQSSEKETLLHYEQYHYVTKNDTILTIEDVSESTTSAHYQMDGEDIIMEWFPGIPVSLYHAYINDMNDSKSVDMNCSTVAPQYVSCRARAAPGCYRAWFAHDAAWTSLSFDVNKFHKDFCHLVKAEVAPTPPRAGGWAGLWWAAGAAAGALLLGLLALLAHRAARSDRQRQSVLRSWVDAIGRRAGRARAAPERVVLLYARDCAALRRAAELLANLLRRAVGCEVLDLYSPDAVAAAAPAPGAWLRAQLARPGARVLLLQSPALALSCARAGPPALQAPLLGSRVAWRQPHAADSLLMLALRLLSDSAHTEPQPFRKYYVAAVEGVPYRDVVPALTPCRRYALPGAARALLAELAPAPATPPEPGAALDPAAQQLLHQLAEALEEFREYARDHPNYLFEDLVFE